MDFWSRLIGSTSAPKKTAPKSHSNDPEARLQRFEKVYYTVLELCNRPRNISSERPLLQNLNACINRIAALLREETRAPVPHSCLQFAASSQCYAVIARAAGIAQDEEMIRASIAVFAALIESEEEAFLASPPFAKSLMRLVTRVVNTGSVVIAMDTETMILEVLFTISAKIRLQPNILPVWFQSTTKADSEDVFVKEKKSFIGITAKEDFPLCYLLIDRVHHEGRIGDFARTGLLYIFEATGRSLELEEWVVSSDLPTLMSTGLGALYSQLSRELSILHFDANLPAVLAMSDYSTTHPRATAESAFSDRHKAHMATFLSYLHFWQDILDHCRSAEVKQTLLDHFQILFLQQLLYPSLLQSSDTDAGSSVAVLTYMTSILESLEYPDLVQNLLTYLLAIREQNLTIPSAPATPGKPPRSPTTLKRRESLLLINAPKDPESVVDPDLFSLGDLITNNIASKNSQSVFAALKLTSTIISRQRRYALGTLLKVHHIRSAPPSRTVGALDLELDRYAELAVALHRQLDVESTYASHCDDIRFVVEAQVPWKGSGSDAKDGHGDDSTDVYAISHDDPLLRMLNDLLRTFWTNSVDVNLALTQAIISIALCVDIRLESWAALYTHAYVFEETSRPSKAWQAHLDSEEEATWSALQDASRRPIWIDDNAPSLYKVLAALTVELNDTVRTKVPNLESLVAGRKIMLQAYELEGPLSEPPSLMSSPTQTSFLEVPDGIKGDSRSSSSSSLNRGLKNKATNYYDLASRHPASSPPDSRTTAFPSPGTSVFRPPPPETPSTTDVLMQTIMFPDVSDPSGPGHAEGKEASATSGIGGSRTASLNHILTNVVVLQEFVLELIAVMQVRASVLADREIRCV